MPKKANNNIKTTGNSRNNNAIKSQTPTKRSSHSAASTRSQKTSSATRSLPQKASHSRPGITRPNSAPLKNNFNSRPQSAAKKVVNSQTAKKSATPIRKNVTQPKAQTAVKETPSKVVQNRLSENLKKISVPKDDKVKSMKTVEKLINPVTTQLKKTSDYKGMIRKSGSYATNTKIKAADEFDYDVPMALKNYSIKKKGSIHYDLQNKHQSLNVPAKVVKTATGTKIPNGYVEVKTMNGEPVIPRKVKEDLHKQLKDVTSSKGNMHLSKYAHGPAVTSTLKKKGFHDISIDFSPSIPAKDVTVKDYQWPRKDTKKVLNKDLIQKISNQDMIAVPKDDKFWYVSASLQEKALLNSIDSKDGGCRKECHKLLKADFQKWRKQSPKAPNAFPNISTIIFKHQLYWMNEKNPNQDWSKSNRHECYPAMLQDLSTTLRSGQLPNYFKTSENLLAGKDQSELNQLANCAGRRRHEILTWK